MSLRKTKQPTVEHESASDVASSSNSRARKSKGTQISSLLFSTLLFFAVFFVYAAYLQVRAVGWSVMCSPNMAHLVSSDGHADE